MSAYWFWPVSGIVGSMMDRITADAPARGIGESRARSGVLDDTYYW
jgi:hypothetical protein